MEGSIFVTQPDGSLKPLRRQAYEAEDVLQELLAGYPDLLAGEQVNPADPRRWLLISREFPVPDPDSGLDRWWLDHLFVDQEGVPTLVEVKRSGNPELRREVVAQMLEYAANASAWSTERIVSRFTDRCDEDGVDAEVELGRIAGERSAEEFWQSVRSNLGSGRLRLVFVADAIPSQLLRIIEFLNAQMDSMQVLALEVPQYVGDGITAYVPRLLGQTAQGQMRRSVLGSASRSSARSIPRDEVERTLLSAGLDEPEKEALAKLIEVLSSADGNFRSGSSNTVFSWYFGVTGRRLVTCYAHGGLEWALAEAPEGMRQDLRDAIAKALPPGVAKGLAKSYPLTSIRDFLTTGNWDLLVARIAAIVGSSPEQEGHSS